MESQSRRFPTVTVALVVLNIIVFAVECFWITSNDYGWILSWSFVPANLTGSMQSFDVGSLALAGSASLAAMFLHASLSHLVGNMLFLFLAGKAVEQRVGSLAYLLLYFGGGIAAFSVYVMSAPNSTIPCLGAGGAVATIFSAYLCLIASSSRYSGLGLLTRLAIIAFGIAWFVSQFIGIHDVVRGLVDSRIAYWAEVGGFLAGLGMSALIALYQRHASRLEGMSSVQVGA
ncbi:MAG: rhomboid family intramembrane serine protease [Cyanobacteria bacterium HKST-UBA02]|nr:rhomboid family intramembrane serine protease [Cyanobacteria bacterium HKST-UBA02]